MDALYWPGSVWASSAEQPLVRAANAACELILGDAEEGALEFAFRFHNAESHLIGVAKDDFTDEAIAKQFQSIREGGRARATLAIIAYAYGDGAAFLYSSATHRLQVQCRLLEVTAEE